MAWFLRRTRHKSDSCCAFGNDHNHHLRVLEGEDLSTSERGKGQTKTRRSKRDISWFKLLALPRCLRGYPPSAGGGFCIEFMIFVLSSFGILVLKCVR